MASAGIAVASTTVAATAAIAAAVAAVPTAAVPAAVRASAIVVGPLAAVATVGPPVLCLLRGRLVRGLLWWRLLLLSRSQRLGRLQL